MKSDSHYPGGNPSKLSVAKEDIEGPTTIQHRNRLGLDVMKDPNGEGMPSTKPMIANQPRKGW